MTEPQSILSYLPSSYKIQSESEYINFLWEAFESNYQGRKYQFAMLAFHMLYMSFVYFSVWQIKRCRPEDFKKAIIFQQREKEIWEASSPFAFSEMKEKSIFRFLRLIAGCEQQHIGQFDKLVEVRNDIAHSNGNIFFNSQASADEKIDEILNQVVAIQQHMKSIIWDCFRDFLIKNADPEEWEYSDSADQIREVLVSANYFSAKDIEDCLSFNIQSLSSQPHFPAIKTLNETFRKQYTDLIEEQAQ